jgi:hypothetical protein
MKGGLLAAADLKAKPEEWAVTYEKEALGSYDLAGKTGTRRSGIFSFAPPPELGRWTC